MRSLIISVLLIGALFVFVTCGETEEQTPPTNTPTSNVTPTASSPVDAPTSATVTSNPTDEGLLDFPKLVAGGCQATVAYVNQHLPDGDGLVSFYPGSSVGEGTSGDTQSYDFQIIVEDPLDREAFLKERDRAVELLTEQLMGEELCNSICLVRIHWSVTKRNVSIAPAEALGLLPADLQTPGCNGG